MKRVSIIRLVLAILVSIGMTLAPVQAARMAPVNCEMSLSETSTQGMPAADQDFACCKVAAHCVMATCAISCTRFTQISEVPKDFAIVGHAPFAGLQPPHLEGLGWRPPIPPPRA
jgi:hypothetical protein